jgi:hypothetical protein
VAAPELFSRGGRARSYETRGSAGAHLVWEARSEGEERMKAPELNSVRRRGPGSRVRSGAVGHVASLKPTSVGRCSPKLQLTWQCVDTYPTSYFDLEFICKVTGLQDVRQLRWFTCDRISMHRLPELPPRTLVGGDPSLHRLVTTSFALFAMRWRG